MRVEKQGQIRNPALFEVTAGDELVRVWEVNNSSSHPLLLLMIVLALVNCVSIVYDHLQVGIGLGLEMFIITNHNISN